MCNGLLLVLKYVYKYYIKNNGDAWLKQKKHYDKKGLLEKIKENFKSIWDFLRNSRYKTYKSKGNMYNKNLF